MGALKNIKLASSTSLVNDIFGNFKCIVTYSKSVITLTSSSGLIKGTLLVDFSSY